MTEDMKILTWFLGSQPVGELLNWPVLPPALCDAVRAVNLESKKDGGDPHEICKGWTALGAAIGPTMIGKILASNEWRDLVPAVEGYGDDWCNVWSDGSKKVVARVVWDGPLAVNVRFTVE